MGAGFCSQTHNFYAFLSLQRRFCKNRGLGLLRPRGNPIVLVSGNPRGAPLSTREVRRSLPPSKSTNERGNPRRASDAEVSWREPTGRGFSECGSRVLTGLGESIGALSGPFQTTEEGRKRTDGAERRRMRTSEGGKGPRRVGKGAKEPRRDGWEGTPRGGDGPRMNIGDLAEA